MRGHRQTQHSGDPPDSINIASNIPNGEMSQWVPIPPNIQTSTDILYVNMEVAYPTSPPFLERDPNMSSTARYSPLHSTSTSQSCLNTPLQHTSHLHPYQHNISKVIPSLPPNSLCDDNRNILSVGTYTLSPSTNTNNQTIEDINATDISQYMNTYSSHIDINTVNSTLQTEEPILNTINPVSCSDDAVNQETNNNFYPQQVFNSDGYEVSSSNDGVFLSSASSISNTENTGQPTQVLDSATDMIVFSSDGGLHMIEKNSIKAEHVRLLISGAQPGISYSLSKENGFIIARQANCLPPKTESLTVNMSTLSSLDDYSQCESQQSVSIDQDNVTSVNLNFIQQNELGSQQNINILPSKMSVKNETDLFMNNEVTDFDDSESNDINYKKRNRKSISNNDISITCIPDKSVPCRAKASLPATHLWLRNDSDEESEVLGVFARRRIPLCARFGPLEGIRKKINKDTLQLLSNSGPHFLLHTDNGDYNIDVSDEKTSNWMRYVRFSPGPNQNLCLQQSDGKLYFTSSKVIPPRSELILGYGVTYAQHWNLPSSLSENEDDEAIEWPCYECPMQFSSSSELQNHLNVHDESEQTVAFQKNKKKITKSCSNNIQCTLCNRTFPRIYSLKRHMRTHEASDFSNHFRKSVDKYSKFHQSDKHDFKLTTDTTENKNQEVKNELVWSSDDQNMKDFASESAHSSPKSNCNVYDTFNSLEKLDDSNINKNQNINILTQNSMDVSMDADSQILSTKNSENIIFDDAQLISCTLCTKKFNRPIQLKEHMQDQHGDAETSYKCSACNKKFPDHVSVKNHFRSKHNTNKFQCQECSFSFNTKYKLQLHMLKHFDNTEFTCPNCNKQFKRKDKLKEHIQRQQRVVNNNKEIIYLCSERANGSLSMNHEDPEAYLNFTFKCHPCRLGFKRRGMLVNHLARRHPEVSRASVPELQLPILRAARDYFCQHCNKVYKSSSKRKAHILKNHPGESLPPSSRGLNLNESSEIENLDFSTCVGSVPSAPHHCPYTPCHKQYASKAKLSQHIKNKHFLPRESKENTKINKPVSTSVVSSSENKVNEVQVNNESDQISNFLSNMNYQGEDKVTTTQQNLDTNTVLSSTSKCRKLPPLQQMLLSKCNGNKVREDSQIEINPPAQNASTEKILEDNLKVSNQFHIDDLIKTLSEMKNGKSHEYKQNYMVSKMSEPTILGPLKYEPNYLQLLHIAEDVEILEKNANTKENGCILMNEIPKLHISGHILSMGSNNLPSINVLSTNSISGGSLVTQYTDR